MQTQQPATKPVQSKQARQQRGPASSEPRTKPKAVASSHNPQPTFQNKTGGFSLASVSPMMIAAIAVPALILGCVLFWMFVVIGDNSQGLDAGPSSDSVVDSAQSRSATASNPLSSPAARNGNASSIVESSKQVTSTNDRPSRSVSSKNGTSRFSTTLKPVIDVGFEFDPFFTYQLTPNYELNLPSDYQTQLACVLSFGGEYHREFYAAQTDLSLARLKLLNPDSSEQLGTPIYGIGAANWNVNVENALKLIMISVGSGSGFHSNSHSCVIDPIFDAYPKAVEKVASEILESGAYPPSVVEYATRIQFRSGFKTGDIEKIEQSLMKLAKLNQFSKELWELYSDQVGTAGANQDFVRELFDSVSDLEVKKKYFKSRTLLNHGAQWSPHSERVAVENDIGMQCMPPNMSKVSHYKIAKLIQASKAYLEKEKARRTANLAPELARQLNQLDEAIDELPDYHSFKNGLRQLQIKFTDFDAITIGNLEVSGRELPPRIAIGKLNRPVDLVNFSELKKVEAGSEFAEALAVYEVDSTKVFAVIDRTTLAIGTRNEVAWAVANHDSDKVQHPVFRQYGDLSNVDFFDATPHQSNTCKFEMGDLNCKITTRVETIIDAQTILDLTDRTLNETSSGSAGITPEDRQRASTDAKKYGVAVPRMNAKCIETQFVRNVSGDYKVVAAPNDILNGFLSISNFSSGSPYVRKLLLGLPDDGLPKDPVVLEEFFRQLARAEYEIEHAYNVGKTIDRFFLAIKEKIQSVEGGITYEQSVPTLELIFAIRHWLNPTQIQDLEAIAELIPFPDSSLKTHWLVAVVSSIHAPESIHKIHKLLGSPGASAALDLKAIPTNPAGASREEVDAQQEKRGLQVRRIIETWDQIATLIEFYAQSGDESLLLSCIQIGTLAPGVGSRVNRRLQLVASQQDSLAIKQTVAAIRLPLKKGKSKDWLELLDDVIPDQMEYEILDDPSAPLVKTENLKQFEHPNRGFELLVPDVLAEQVRVLSKGSWKNAQALRDQIDAENYKGSFEDHPDYEEEIRSLFVRVHNGDIVSAGTEFNSQAQNDWKAIVGALGSRLISESAGDSNAMFDRILFYKTNDTPMAVRKIYWSEGTGFEIKWIGRGQKEHPGYAMKILMSFKLRAGTEIGR